MIKFSYLVALLLLTSGNSSANTQFSREQCQQLNQQRKAIRSQLRQPYTAEQGQKLQEKQRQLLRLLQAHCKKPNGK